MEIANQLGRWFLLFAIVAGVFIYGVLPLFLRSVMPFLDQFGFIFMVIHTGILLITPVAILCVAVGTPPISAAVKVWKWITGTSAVLVILPFVLLLGPPLLGAPTAAGDPRGFALIPVVLFGFPLMLLGIVGLLISEWIAEGRTQVTGGVY